MKKRRLMTTRDVLRGIRRHLEEYAENTASGYDVLASSNLDFAADLFRQHAMTILKAAERGCKRD